MGTTTAIVVLGIIALAIWLVISRGLDMKRLAEDGIDVDGVVLRQFKHNTKGSQSTSHFLRYLYCDSTGQAHEHKSNVTYDFWIAHPEGHTIAITYSQSRPQVSAPRYLVEQARAALNPKKD